MASEVAGRICTIVQLNELTENDFYVILNSDGISPVDSLADYYGVRLKMSAKAKHKLAKDEAFVLVQWLFIQASAAKEITRLAGTRLYPALGAAYGRTGRG